jgi:ABC-2 type transport system permease protein
VTIGRLFPYGRLLCFTLVILAMMPSGIKIHEPLQLSIICFLFLLFSLGLGLLISSILKTQTQAIQFSVFLLLPIMLLSGAFSALRQLPLACEFFPSSFR